MEPKLEYPANSLNLISSVHNFLINKNFFSFWENSKLLSMYHIDFVFGALQLKGHS